MRWCVVATVLGISMAALAAEPVKLVPPPKEVAWAEGEPVALTPGKVAIVLGDKAVPAETAAADMLRRYVAKRFNAEWPVVRESDDLSRYETVILLGQAGTHGQIDRILRERNITVKSPVEGSDGYAIEIVPDASRTAIVVAGSNGRAVTYGQDTLFQLLRRSGDRLQLVRASIRDWASIAWRGRPMTDVTHYLEPGTWDGLISSRMNWIDLRNGTYAFEPDYVLTDEDKKNIAEVIAEAHRREILVYGAVNCGVPAKLYDAVLAMFRQFIEMGVDGLWISFDDRGPGEAPEEITREVLALGEKHAMTGSRIATTPPKGSYQTVTAPFNRKIAGVPGMERALWFWTPLPDETFAADAREIGLAVKPSWWHNWPRVLGGFTHIRSRNLNTDLAGTYVEIPALEVGWHEPSYEMIADAAQHVLAVVPWSGNHVAKEYVAPAFGWWSWSPEQHDWPATRARIFDTVYGPEQVAAMIELEDTLVRARSLFAFAMNPGPWRPNCPARLKRLEDRPLALELLGRCETLAARVAAGYAQGTLLDAHRVGETFVAPLQREIRVGQICAVMDYPEYWWNDHQRALLDAVYDGRMERADELIAAARPRVLQAIERIGRELRQLTITAPYVEFWTKTAGMSAADWRAAMQARQEELARRVWHYSYYSVVIDKLLPNLLNPPTGWGRGGTSRQMRVLATALPDLREHYWGDWLAGIYRNGREEAAVFAMEPDAAARAGDFAELPVRLPVSCDRNRLGLLVFMNRWTKELLGNEEVPGRWMGYAKVQILWQDRVVWEADPGLPRTGCEWSLVSLPPIPEDVKELDLRLRVVDQRDSNGMRAIVFVGPLRLVQMPR